MTKKSEAQFYNQEIAFLFATCHPRKGPGKLRSYWENEIYEVVKRQSEESPVYAIKQSSKEGRLRTVHRSLLLPCPDLQLEQPKERTRA